MNLYDILAGQGTTHFERLFSQKFACGEKTQTMTGTPPLTFKANGKPLILWSMLGNGQQTGTPSPDNIIVPTFCGKLVCTDWAIPITCAGQTTPVYLGEVPTVRRVKKFVLDGTEAWDQISGNAPYRLLLYTMMTTTDRDAVFFMCSHFIAVSNNASWAQYDSCISVSFSGGSSVKGLQFRYTAVSSLDDFKAYLAAQYAAGNPVTVWYVLANPTTGIVNEPLAKIGDYADELSSTDAGVTIPTVKGSNVLTVGTDLQPSEMTITYKG